MPVLAFTPVAKVRSQLSLSWGVETFLITDVEHTDEMVRQVDEALLEIGRVSEGDQVVIIAGSPPGSPGRPTPCASTGWATPSTRSPRRTAAPRLTLARDRDSPSSHGGRLLTANSP